MPFQVLSHTADTGIEATSDTLPGLLAALATGMFEFMEPVPPGTPGEPVTVEVESASLEDLVVDLLSELLFVSESEDAMLTRFEVELPSPTNARVTTTAVPIDRSGMVGAPIKAVTYHDLTIEERDGGWYGRVYFDV